MCRTSTTCSRKRWWWPGGVWTTSTTPARLGRGGGIAKKLVQAHCRQRNVRRCTEATLDQLDARLTQIARHPGDTWQDKLELLQGCVEALPEHYHAVVMQRYFRDQAIEQLAETLRLTVAAARSGCSVRVPWSWTAWSGEAHP